MLLYNYSPSDLHTSYYVRVHEGQGLGSLFARLFSKIAVKTAAKTALNVAKVAGKKAIKVAARQGLKVGKKALKVAAREGASFAREAGRDAIQEAKSIAKDAASLGIDFLAQKARNKGIPTETVQSIANLARGKTQAGADTLSKVATRKLNTSIDNLVAKHLPSLQPAAVTKKKQRKRKAGKQQQHKHSKKRKTTNRQKTLSELIEQV